MAQSKVYKQKEIKAESILGFVILRMKKYSQYYLLLFTCCTLSSQEQEWSIGTQSQSYSNIAPVLQIIRDDWQSPPNKNASKGFSQTRSELTYQFDLGISVSAQHRMDYFVKTTPLTALGFYLEQHDLPFKAGERFPLTVQLSQHRALGVGVAYQHQWHDLTIKGQINYWESDYLRDLNATGEVRTGENGHLLGHIAYQETYSHNNVLKRPMAGEFASEGQGMSVDINILYQLTQNWLAQLNIIDLYNAFDANDLGYSNVDINTKGSFVENKGFSSFRPLLKGTEGKRNYHLTLPRQMYFKSTMLDQSLHYSLEFNRLGDHNFAILGVGKQFESQRITFKYDVYNRVPEIQYTNDMFEIGLAMDDIDPNEAMALKLYSSINVQFN